MHTSPNQTAKEVTGGFNARDDFVRSFGFNGQVLEMGIKVVLDMENLKLIETSYNLLEKNEKGILPYNDMTYEGQKHFNEFKCLLDNIRNKGFETSGFIEWLYDKYPEYVIENMGQIKVKLSYRFAKKLVVDGHIDVVLSHIGKFSLNYKQVESIFIMGSNNSKVANIERAKTKGELLETLNNNRDREKTKEMWDTIYDIIELGGYEDVLHFLNGNTEYLTTKGRGFNSAKGKRFVMAIELMISNGASPREILNELVSMKKSLLKTQSGNKINEEFEKSFLNKIICDPVLRFALEERNWTFLMWVKRYEYEEYYVGHEEYKKLEKKSQGVNIPFKGSLLEKISSNYLYYLALEKMDLSILDKLLSKENPLTSKEYLNLPLDLIFSGDDATSRDPLGRLRRSIHADDYLYIGSPESHQYLKWIESKNLQNLVLN